MKRRTFGLMATTSMLALAEVMPRAFAQEADFATLSKTTLTPFGSERAGNADGSIPEWTGGYTTVPDGWTRDQQMPDIFGDEQPVVVIDSSNMAQYEDRLSEGVKYMMQNLGFSIKVYPTHRTAAAPQFVYDNIALNATRAQVNPGGARLGFSNAYGGIPFPIPDASDPFTAGAQVIWNHNARWSGYQQTEISGAFVVNYGMAPVLTSGEHIKYKYPYYDPNGSLETFNGYLYKAILVGFAPSTNIGSVVISWETADPNVNPVQDWELLAGQGRVRKTPEVQYDTPSSFSDGLNSLDETYVFNGALDRYDWKLLGKKEMYIPYNNNKIALTPRAVLAGPKFFNPDIIRWELHRVWVVDATLHPGERNVVPHRRLYVDEDTWTIAVGDSWDASGNLWKALMNYNVARPDLPGTIRLWSVVNNFQQRGYVLMDGTYNDPGFNTPCDFYTPIPDSAFDANIVAANSSY
jgi:hypothetical protein